MTTHFPPITNGSENNKPSNVLILQEPPKERPQPPLHFLSAQTVITDRQNSGYKQSVLCPRLKLRFWIRTGYSATDWFELICPLIWRVESDAIPVTMLGPSLVLKKLTLKLCHLVLCHQSRVKDTHH